MSDPYGYEFGGSDFDQSGDAKVTEKKMPDVHLGHHIGPAPTNAELGISLPDDHCPVCHNLFAVDSDGKRVCLECGHEG